MTSKKHVVRVHIMGEEYTIRSEATPEHTREVATYLDRAIRGVASSGSVIETHRAAILAALQITAELFDARENQTKLAADMKGLGAEVRRVLPPGKRESGAVRVVEGD